MSTEELLFIKGQVECSHPACHLHDFLPIKCIGCKQPFCTLHYSPFYSASTHSHNCSSPPKDRVATPCPICALPVGTPEGQDPNITMDRHMNDPKCAERQAEVGREKEALRAKKARGETCFARGCKKGLMGGLGVKCSSCTHSFCTNHRFPSSHSCSTINLASSSTPSSRTPTPAPLPSGVRQVLGGPSREAALAAIKRQGPSTAKPKEPQPLKPKEKDVNPNEKRGGGIKPLVNPLSATSRHTKAEAASRRKALAHRAKLGVLTAEEKVAWAELVGSEESGRRKKEASGKKDGCAIS